MLGVGLVLHLLEYFKSELGKSALEDRSSSSGSDDGVKTEWLCSNVG